MLRVCTIALCSFLVFASVNAATISYRANIAPLSNTSTTPASGFVTIFTDESLTVIGYAGIVINVEPNLLASACNATNGCGVHIHSGRSCRNVTTQLGHYFNNASVPIDPWIDERYSSDAAGKANFQSIIQIGTIDIEGRAFIGMCQRATKHLKVRLIADLDCHSFCFTRYTVSMNIVHSMNGTRIGCGIIERVPSGTLHAKTTNLTVSGVTSKVVVQQIGDAACYFGSAKNLEPNLVSYLNKNKTLLGMNCNFTNGCGVHIHNGTSCFNSTTQGGHYYNQSTYPIDPWLYTMYHSTNQYGDAYFTGCVRTGVDDFTNRPFVVHSNSGSRISCGLLRNETDSFLLINPTTDLPLGPLPSVIDYSTLSTSTLNIMAKFVEPYKSAQITFDNPLRYVCEKTTPFSVFGDNKGNFAKAVIPVGYHEVSATPYTTSNCTGVPGEKLFKSILVEGCKLQFVGRDVSTNLELFRLLPLTTAPAPLTAINIEAVVTCGFRIQDVQFVLRDNTRNKVIRRQTETEAPYFVFSNKGTNIKPGRKFAAGSYSLSASVNDIYHGLFNFTLT
jgi:hypothetical protein